MQRDSLHDADPGAPVESMLRSAPDNSSPLVPESSGWGRSRMSRRAFLHMVGVAAAGTALASCAPRPTGPGPHGSSTVQLVYQDWRTEWFPGMAQEMLEQFQASHHNFHVFYAPDPENLGIQMLADMQAGTAPDVFDGCCDFFPVWAQKGYLLDLRPFVRADLDQGTIGDWDAAQYRAFFSRDGAQYALPKYHGALALYYNKDLFDRYRVDYPDTSWNHADYGEAARRLTTDRNGHGPIDLWGSMIGIGWERLQVHVNAWGGHFVDPADSSRSLMAAPEALAAMQWVRDRMWDDRSMATTLDVQNVGTRQAFVEQRVAMVEDGSWVLKDILEQASFRVGVAPVPTGPVRRATLASTDGFGIYAGTKYPEAAWELLKFLVSPDYGRAMIRAQLLQPARLSLIDEWIGFIRQQYPEKSREMDLAAFADGQRQGYSVTVEKFANMAAAREVAQPAWEQIFTLGQAPVETMRQVSARIEQGQSA